MKYPLDKICIKSGMLCPRCQRIVDSGVVKDFEIPIMRRLMDLEDSVKELKKAIYRKAAKSGKHVVIVVEGVGSYAALEKVSKKLSEETGLFIKLVEQSTDRRKIIEQVISPITLAAVNSVWLPDGSEIVVAVVPKKEQRFLGEKARDYEAILSSILDTPTRIRYA